MKQPTYNYRVLHKLFEKFFGLIAPFISIRPVSDPRVLPKRVLVIKFGGIGEAVLARSLMETLCRRNPSMSFDCLVEDIQVLVVHSGIWSSPQDPPGNSEAEVRCSPRFRAGFNADGSICTSDRHSRAGGVCSAF